MQKVTSVNLNGNAYQLEEDAYAILQTYLAQAREKLSDNPDQTEIMQDFEQAIAEKCEQLVHKHKNVVSHEEMKKIIASMGPVQSEAKEEPTAHKAETPHDEDAPKRLYTLKEGAVLGGVCKGLAAYFNIDVTIVRLLFVVLAFATSGFWILIYFIAMLVVPEARTPEQKAELRGERFTAADVLDRAKKKYAEVSTQEHWQKVRNTTPALSDVGATILKIMRVLAVIAIACVAVAMVALTAVWAVAMWTVISGSLQLQDQLSTISVWAIAGGITAVYALYLLPAVLLMFVLRRFVSSQPISGPGAARLSIVACSAWVLALIAVICVGTANAGRVHDYQQTHGYLYFNSHKTQKICINSDICTFGVRNHTPIEDRY